MSETIEIGQALRQYRIRARINQDAMARTLGVSQSQISRWESGRDRPRAHNIDAIKALIWGRKAREVQALATYVKGAQAPLALFDDDLRIIAASPFLRMRGGPLAMFGWLFDPDINPTLARMAQRFRSLARSEPVIGLAIPFSHENRPWACHGRLTVSVIGADLHAIGEMSFVRDDKQTVRTIALTAAVRPGAMAGPDRA